MLRASLLVARLRSAVDSFQPRNAIWTRLFCTNAGEQESPKPAGPAKENETDLVRHLKTRIMMGGGPISVAEYMKEVLTNPQHGFYMNRDVFGTGGDFITSPEISQMFGELVGIWSVCTWQQMGSPAAINIVEMGPGRGTLMADFLRGTQALAPFASALNSVHLVEISPALRKKQWATLKCQGEIEEVVDGKVGVSQINGCKIQWHRSLAHVPKEIPEIIVAHEFMDALPVHQFAKTDQGWCERLVDVAEADDPSHFRFVLSPKATPAFAILGSRRLAWMSDAEKAACKQMEVGGQMLVAVVDISKRVTETRGAALVIDYGKDGCYESSVQAIRRHKVGDILNNPGCADLSAHVDFTAIRKAVEESRSEAVAHGPVEQGWFLRSLGIDARLEALCRDADGAQVEKLTEGCQRLIEPAGEDAPGMGEIYKVMAITGPGIGAPVAFEN
ncbi:hypothetical protein BSKO_01817 [Bryopsis sp. KO-2023]|nr:hypothetical protein BSKO_01817 [Bryopsis sp. KO-2023]